MMINLLAISIICQRDNQKPEPEFKPDFDFKPDHSAFACPAYRSKNIAELAAQKAAQEFSTRLAREIKFQETLAIPPNHSYSQEAYIALLVYRDPTYETEYPAIYGLSNNSLPHQIIFRGPNDIFQKVTDGQYWALTVDKQVLLPD